MQTDKKSQKKKELGPENEAKVPIKGRRPETDDGVKRREEEKVM